MFWLLEGELTRFFHAVTTKSMTVELFVLVSKFAEICFLRIAASTSKVLLIDKHGNSVVELLAHHIEILPQLLVHLGSTWKQEALLIALWGPSLKEWGIRSNVERCAFPIAWKLFPFHLLNDAVKKLVVLLVQLGTIQTIPSIFQRCITTDETAKR